MDTKWNSTERPAVPLSAGTARSGRAGALAGLLAFFLGVSLTVSALGSVGGRIAWERDLFPRWTDDWQETNLFRQQVASCLKDFLTIGAGGQLDFYDYSTWSDQDGRIIEEAIVQSTPDVRWFWGTTEAVPSTADYGLAEDLPEPGSSAPAPDREPDEDYQRDKNVLYSIQGGGKSYTNCDPSVGPQAFRQGTIEGYSFYLIFENGKASIRKDGQQLDVYGGGVYNRDSQWFVPGYDNFPASDQLDGVTVLMAVREAPIRYYGVDYQTGSSYSGGSMYYIAQRVEETRAFYRTQAVLLAAGLGCLVLWLFLRRATEPANRKIASWTVHVWTEARFLLVLALLWLGAGGADGVSYALRETWWYYDPGYTFSEAAAYLARAALASPPALLPLIWVIWLIHNDHRYNPKEARRSLLRPFLRGLRARGLKRPVQKRLSRRAALTALAALLLGAETVYFLIVFTVFVGGPSWMLWTIYFLPVLLLVLAAAALARRELGLSRDLGLLADQVEAVRAGDLSRPLTLPRDADLRQTAEALNDIQAGMKAALEEQTRSERMKVELISNVSHDLKTPLTSILSYAELLRQEGELPPAAADYARIIDEKARRLKGMVEDVFEVSKAAADQLPVHLERLDLGKLLRQTLADLDGPIRASALTFRVDLPDQPVMITADGKRLYRVFQNLIDNALRYALEGSRVYLTLRTPEGLAEASVRNTSRTELPEGVDFTARFVRGDASRTDGGSGLGLSIASSFVEACGGSFRVETVADLFTAVVTFPTEPDADAEL